MKGVASACLALSLLLAGCAPGTGRSTMTADPQLMSDLALVGRARIFFGHQSVGANIIQGLEELQHETNTAGIRVVALDMHEMPAGAALVHAAIGENGHPFGKIDAFTHDLARLEETPDIALMKFCYLDFVGDASPDTVFAAYVDGIRRLQARYPNTVFIHVTTPLKAAEPVKGIIKVLVGRGDPKRDNVLRNQYNRLLRRRFPDPVVFDLAALESTASDSTRTTFKMSGVTYELLSPEYSSDGGHLNTVGRRAAISGFIHALANAVRATPALAARLGAVPAVDLARASH